MLPKEKKEAKVMDDLQKMKPIALLMIEHRLIERMVALLKNEGERIRHGCKANHGLLLRAVDFYRMYADKCHHGKEEDILFRQLEKKDMSPEHKNLMEELLSEHVQGRKIVSRLADAADKISKGDLFSSQEALACLQELVALYTAHISKEDHKFFLPVMAYFSKNEQSQMMKAFLDFDMKLVHEHYRKIVEELEKGN
jgi:hemerythrin-like domain-containing protein